MAVFDSQGKRYHSNTAMKMRGGSAGDKMSSGEREKPPKAHMASPDKAGGKHENPEEHNDVSQMPISEAVEKHGPAHTIHMEHDHDAGTHKVHSIHGHEKGGHHHHSEHDSAEDAHDHARQASGIDMEDTNDPEEDTYEPEDHAGGSSEVPAIPGL